jgi:hypothetical protein
MNISTIEELNKSLRKSPIVAIPANHRGDMYHVKGLMSLFSNIHVLILFDSQEMKESQKEEMKKYFISGGLDNRVHIGDKKELSKKKKEYFPEKDAKKILNKIAAIFPLIFTLEKLQLQDLFLLKFNCIIAKNLRSN